jgi:serine/threonine protein kinase
MNKSKGGKAIAAGGYGCVFYPSLPCVGTGRTPNSVSKIFSGSEFLSEEERDTNKVKQKLSSIPNYSRYFVLDISSCNTNVDLFTSSDLEDYDKKCEKKVLRYSTMVHQSKNRTLKILNIPYAGVEINYFVTSNSKQTINEWNKNMIDLLLNGIIPMNRKGVYHSDIKDTNILVDKNNIPRLIDWGLVEFKSKSSSYSSNKYYGIWKNRPFMVNSPYSIVFNTELFVSSLKSYNGPFEKKELTNFLNTFVSRLRTENYGHFDYISYNILPHIYKEYFDSQNKNKYLESGQIIIVEYLCNVLLKYNKNITRYFEEVFSKNTDIWGFVMSYFPIVTGDNGASDFSKRIIKIIRYMIENMQSVYDINYIVQELTGSGSNVNPVAQVEPVAQVAPVAKVSPVKQVAQVKQVSPVKQVAQVEPVKQVAKRCPKGTRRNKKTGNCEPSGKEPSGKKSSGKFYTANLIPVSKRCPKGTRRNKKTGNCEPK